MAGPVFSAHRISRCGVHSAYSRCAAGLLGDRGMAPLEVGADVAGHPLALVKAFHGVGGETGIQLAFDQQIGDRGEMAVDLDVVVDVHPYLLPLSEHVGFSGQGPQSRFVQGLEQGLAGAG